MRVAEQAGDQETVEIARRIRDQEQSMADRLAGAFDNAVEASLREVSPENMSEQLLKYLADAHAIESQAIALLERAPKIAGELQLALVCSAHLMQTREHQRLVRDRLEARGGKPSRLKDAAMRLGGLNWGTFFQAHPDTPGKLAAFAFAFEHLEIAGYELLKRVAQRVGDQETLQLAERILTDERSAAAKIAATFDSTAEASLRARGAIAGQS